MSHQILYKNVFFWLSVLDENLSLLVKFRWFSNSSFSKRRWTLTKYQGILDIYSSWKVHFWRFQTHLVILKRHFVWRRTAFFTVKLSQWDRHRYWPHITEISEISLTCGWDNKIITLSNSPKSRRNGRFTSSRYQKYPGLLPNSFWVSRTSHSKNMKISRILQKVTGMWQPKPKKHSFNYEAGYW